MAKKMLIFLLLAFTMAFSIQPSAQKPAVISTTTVTNLDNIAKHFNERIIKDLNKSQQLVEKFKKSRTVSTLMLKKLTGDQARERQRKKKEKSGKDQVVLHQRSKEDFTLSPCKINKISSKLLGGHSIYGCAPREEQKNKFSTLECRTVYRRSITSSFAIKSFAIGCELRYRKGKKHCNKHLYSNTKGC